MDLDNFCGEQFWNSTLSWYTDTPDLTRCFEKTILVWLPCLFFWLFSPLEVYYFLTSKCRNIPWNWINTSKLGVTAMLIAVQIAELFAVFQADVIHDVNFYTPVIKGLTIAFSGVLVAYNRKYGVNTSGLQFLFWFFLMLCGIPQLRTEIRDPRNEDSHIIYIIYFVLVVIVFLLNCFSDKPPQETVYAKTQNPCPEPSAGFLSRLVFAWFDGLLLQGYKKPLEQSDLYDIPPGYSTKEIFDVYEKHWKNTVEKCKAKKTQASFLPALFKTFGAMFFFGAFFRLITDLLTFVNPNILGLIITFVREQQETWKGVFYAVLLFMSAIVQSFFSQQFQNRNQIISMRIRSALIALVYKKSLVLSNAARKDKTVGEIVNLMSIDAQRFGDIGNTINILWSAPLKIGLSIYFLWQELGPSVLAGLSVLIILFPINAVIANISKKLHMRNMKNKDERVKLMNEILSGIRILKLYAWEKSFEEQVLKVRAKELQTMKKTKYLHAGTSFIMHCTPFLVALASFTTYVFIDEKNTLDANKAFVSLSLFNIINNPLQQLPMLITSLLQMWVSVKRLKDFLNAEEVNSENVHHECNKEYPIAIEKGTFSWDDTPTLEDINISLKANTLTAVVGSVGSGKSSLLSAVLGEMIKLNGKVNTYGSIAYVPQQAWIQNASLKDNVLFGRPFNEERYAKTIEACALTADIEILPAKDETEIGEKGINLSGGQKQRVSLARAVYADADIYLLDDPLSAVDTHVGKHIFQNVIGSKGLLNHKTKILVTHAVTYLPHTNQIVVMKNGRVVENDTYQELLARKGDFAEFLMQHISNDTIDEEELKELKDQLGDVVVEEEIQKRLSRQTSRTSLPRSEGEGPELQLNGSIGGKKSPLKGKPPFSGKPPGKQLKGFGKRGMRPPGRDGKLIEKEKAEIGNVQFGIYKYYLQNVGYHMIFLIFAIQILTQAFGIGTNLWLGKWSDDNSIVVDGVVNTFKRDMYLGVYGAIGFGQALTVISSNVVYAIATLAAAYKIHKCLLENTLRLPLSFFDTTPIGRILGRFSSDINGVDGMLPGNLQSVLSSVLRIFGTLGVISYSTPLFITVIVPLVIIYFLIQRFYIATSRQLRRLGSVTRSPIFSHFGETLTGVQTIRAYGEEDRFLSVCYARIDQNQVCSFPSMTAHRWLGIRLEIIGNIVIFFAALFAVLAKDLSPALVGLSVTYSLQITNTLKMIVNLASNVEVNIVSLERIKEYQDNKREAAWDKPDNLPKDWPENGSVQFKNYGLRYREGLDMVLQDLNINIKAGEKIGVVGRTGAGKSSLTLGLFRLIEASQGQIEIDDVNVSELGLYRLRSSLTIIPQDPVLFAGTLRTNLDPFIKHSDDALWRALEHAHLKHFVKGLPAGLQHEITEGGQNLSVGQKQLICLARALLRNTKILILDEATAAVDLETDDLIQKTIKTEFKHCTVLTIAHRLNTIMDSDRIIVLDKGNVVEFDTPANLVDNKDSVFSGMHKNAGLS